MKVGLINTFDSFGGAARCTYRLHSGLLKKGVDSKMIVQIKESDNQFIYGPGSKIEKLKASLIPAIDKLPLSFYPKRDGRTFSTGWLNSLNLDEFQNSCDVFNLHWVGNGFQSIDSIHNIKIPLVLSLHDSWTFTGGCHVPYQCEKFTSDCGECIALNSFNKRDLSYQILKSKKKKWKKKEMVLVGDSNWVANNARKSAVFCEHRIEVINPGLDLNVYKPYDKIQARKILGLSETDKIILFGAISATSDYNKGFHLLVPALQKIVGSISNMQLVVFGASGSSLKELNINLSTKYIGKLYDDISLSLLYSSADVMVVPSLQEAFGQTASESFACGTPVVAFCTSGLLDIVDHKVNGFLASPYDPNELAEGIVWVLSDEERWKNLSQEARKKAVKNFGLEKFVDAYYKVYSSILKK